MLVGSSHGVAEHPHRPRTQRAGRPGKICLLELIAEHGSISAAGRALGMSYRRAWLLVDELNHLFAEPVVAGQIGGRSGGGASLTPFGARLVECYREIERQRSRPPLAPSLSCRRPLDLEGPQGRTPPSRDADLISA